MKSGESSYEIEKPKEFSYDLEVELRVKGGACVHNVMTVAYHRDTRQHKSHKRALSFST